MRFEWDESKRLSNLEKHGLDFFDVIEVFQRPHVVVPSTYAAQEERFLAIGILKGRFVTASYTIRHEALRIISFRKARYAERKKYQELYGSRTQS